MVLNAHGDISPKFYPVAIGVRRSTLHVWAVVAALRGAEPADPFKRGDRRVAGANRSDGLRKSEAPLRGQCARAETRHRHLLEFPSAMHLSLLYLKFARIGRGTPLPLREEFSDVSFGSAFMRLRAVGLDHVF